MTTDQAKALQIDLLSIVKRYNEQGAAYDDIAKCVMHVASVVAITAELELKESVDMFEFLFRLAESEVVRHEKN